jgi:hypothetical protein
MDPDIKAPTEPEFSPKSEDGKPVWECPETIEMQIDLSTLLGGDGNSECFFCHS